VADFITKLGWLATPRFGFQEGSGLN